MIANLFDLRSSDRNEYGGKAALLGEMKARGLSVFPGCAVAGRAYQAALREIDAPGIGMSPTREQVYPSRDHVHASLIASATAIRIAEGVIAAVPSAKRHSDILVRSSATVEDSTTSSFAGQFESVRSTRGEQKVVDAVARVWASTFDPHVLQYLRRRLPMLPAGVFSMGLVVQPYRRFRQSGVLFSTHPTAKIRGWMLVEIVAGNPADLVAGLVTPSRCRIRDDGLRIIWESTPNRGAQLAMKSAAMLAAAGRTMRDAIGAEVDLEWGLAGSEIVALQCRPVTA